MGVTSAKQTVARTPDVGAAPAQKPSGAPRSEPAAADVFQGLSIPQPFAASPGAPNREPSSERLNEWKAWQQSTLGIADGLGRGIDQGIVSVVTGLNALGINTTMSCEGHLTPRSHPSPIVGIGAATEVFAFRFEGQRESFDKNLREISVPLLVRLGNPLTVGFFPLTSDMLRTIDTPELRKSYPQFWDKISDAYHMSFPQGYITPPLFTAEEQTRRTTNTELLAKVTALVDEFNSGRADAELHAPHIRWSEGMPFDLVFGNHPDKMPRDEALLQQRQAVAADFGRFLQEKFLLA